MSMYQKQESPRWIEFNNYSAGFIENGFPFNEGFPKTPYDIEHARFELLLRSGERCQAIVDYSRQYRAEGLEWLALTSTKIFEPGRNIGKQVVVAWKEL